MKEKFRVKYKHGNYGWFSFTKKEVNGGASGTGCYSTPHGMVGISYHFNPHWTGYEKFSYSFDFVWNGYKHSVTYHEIVGLSDRSIKIYATKFVNSIVKP